MEISSTLTLIFSHKLANSLIKVIFVAKKALEAYFINSAALLDVLTYLHPLILMANKDFLKSY